MENANILGKGKFLVLILSMIFLLSLVSADSDIFKVVSVTGAQDSGIQVDCPTGYTVTGGGFADRSSIDDDQDASYPKENGWYCQEDNSDAHSECYAVCWDSDLISTNLVIDNSKQSHGRFVECEDEESIFGGGFGIEWKNDNDQDESYPKENGWYCKDGESYTGDEGTKCYAICGEAEDDYEMTCETKEVKGNLEYGTEVFCDAGTYLTSGGFRDRAGNHDDQDNNYPINNGWYCQEDRSSGDSVCYARCCSAESNDEDEDGYDKDNDCDDNDYNVNPGADEDCSTNYDDDCDGYVNEGCQDVDDDECRFKVNFNAWENWFNGDVSEKIFIGEDSTYYNVGQWISLEDADNGLNKNVPGLAIQREGNKLVVLLYGSHANYNNQNKEAIDGFITIENGEFTEIKNGDWSPYERWNSGSAVFGNAGNDEAYLVSSTVSSFITTVTTHNDAYHLYYECGETDECDDGDVETAQCGQTDIGVCEYGVKEKTCDDGVWGDFGNCVGDVGPGIEICDDGLDNDCDGEADEDCDSCVPVDEICDDGLDNDCDSYVDDDDSDCDSCVPEIMNESSEWINTSICINNLTTQERTLTEYDNNSCGDFDGKVYIETRNISCSSENNETDKCCTDANCTADYYSERYCSGDDVYRTFHNFTCDDGSCVDNVTELFVKECDEDCDDGKCVSDDDDDDDNSWNTPTYFMQNTKSGLIGENSLNTIQLGNKDESDYSLWWLVFIFALILLILIVAIMIIRTMLG